MSIFERFDPSSFEGFREATGHLEELAYEFAARELASGDASPGIMAKAYGRAEGDEKKARALYLEFRAAQVKPKIRKELKVREEELRRRERRRANERRRKRRQERRREAGEARKEPENAAIILLIAFIVAVFIVTAMVS